MTEVATLIISALGAVAAVASAVIAYSVYTRQAEQDRPSVGATISRDGNVCRVAVTITNRSDCQWAATSAKVVSPWFSGIISEHDAPQKHDGYGSRSIDIAKLAEMKLRRTAPMHVSVARVGSNGSMINVYGSRDHHSETLFVLLPRWMLSSRLSILISLASNEADQRKIQIAITRTLPAETKTAMA